MEFELKGHERPLDTYFGLKEELEALFGRPVNLVMPNAVRNPYLKAGIERSRRAFYAAVTLRPTCGMRSMRRT